MADQDRDQDKDEVKDQEQDEDQAEDQEQDTGQGEAQEQHEDQQRLDALGKTIAEAREHAEDVIPEMEDDEQRFHESGEQRPQDDDQTAAPV